MRLFFVRVYTLACRTELNNPVRDGRAGEINGNYVCTFAFEESNPPAAIDDGRLRSFSEKKTIGLLQASHRPLACTLIILPYLVGKQKYVSRILVLVSLGRRGSLCIYM